MMFKKQGNIGKDKKFKPKDVKEHKERIVSDSCSKPRHFKAECPKQVEESD